jgi:hypothetical protein
MKKLTLIFLGCLAVLSFSGCSIFKQSVPTPTFPPTPSQTQALPTVTPIPPTQTLPTATITPQPTKTSAPFQPITAKITVDNFKLRIGPGFLFATIALYDSSNTVKVIGRAQGDNWLYVETEDHLAGWMKVEYLELQGDLETLPFIAVDNAQIIIGHVRTQSNIFASGIGILFSPQSGYNGVNGDSTLTDSTGTFYLYLPENLEGEYFIGPNGYNCTGNLMVGKCELPYVMPPVQPIKLPPPAGVTIEFVLK